MSAEERSLPLQLSATEFFERLQRNDLVRPLTLTGMVKPSEDGGSEFNFSIADCRSWIKVPLDAIESAQIVGEVTCDGDHSHPKVRIAFKKPDDASLWMYNLLLTIGRAVYRMSATYSAALSVNADPSCLACIHQCELIVVTEDDPFARIICMLQCPTCP